MRTPMVQIEDGGIILNTPISEENGEHFVRGGILQRKQVTADPKEPQDYVLASSVDPDVGRLIIALHINREYGH